MLAAKTVRYAKGRILAYYVESRVRGVRVINKPFVRTVWWQKRPVTKLSRDEKQKFMRRTKSSLVLVCIIKVWIKKEYKHDAATGTIRFLDKSLEKIYRSREANKKSMTNISKRIPNSLYKRAIMPPERKNRLTLVFLLQLGNSIKGGKYYWY